MLESEYLEQSTNPQKNFLYVILHGLICLIDNPKSGFTGYLTDMGSAHKYLCGDFMEEQEIPEKEELKLAEVISGNGHLDPDYNAVVKEAHITSGMYPHSKIDLPRPLDPIRYYITGKLDAGDLEDPGNELQKKPKHISGIRVFQYNFKDFNAVKVIDSDNEPFWQCSRPTPIGDTYVTTLHIYNEPDNELADPKGHNIQEFNRTLDYMKVQRAVLKNPAIVEPNDWPPSGVLPEELYSLDTRPSLASLLLSRARSGRIDLMAPRAHPKGGGGGTQVCGGANGILA